MDFICSQASLEYIILPPSLPDEAEGLSVTYKAERDLLHIAVYQLQVYMSQVPSEIQQKWRIVRRMLQMWVTISSSRTLQKGSLEKIFCNLKVEGELLSSLKRYFAH